MIKFFKLLAVFRKYQYFCRSTLNNIIQYSIFLNNMIYIAF